MEPLDELVLIMFVSMAFGFLCLLAATYFYAQCEGYKCGQEFWRGEYERLHREHIRLMHNYATEGSDEDL